MLEFCRYFFGAGDTIEFENFTLPHFLPILLAVGIIFLIYHFRNNLRDMKREHYIRYVMAFMMIISELSYFWRLAVIPSLNGNVLEHLPITVCGWMIVFASYMMVGKSQTLFDICYFWSFSGTIFALITPTVISYTGPTRYRYYQFWVEHLMGYVGLFYLIFVHNMRPTIKSAVKSYIGLVILAAFAYYVNNLLGPGANYLFMAEPESTPSVLDILPPNFTLRIFVMASVVTLMFFLSYLPWLLKDRKAAKVTA